MVIHLACVVKGWLLYILYCVCSVKREVPIQSCREGKPTSCNVLNVSNSHPTQHGLPSVSLLNQTNWQEATVASLAKSDDLNLCPGSELLSSAERQVTFSSFNYTNFFIYNALCVLYVSNAISTFQICQILRLRPLYYISLKTNLILVSNVFIFYFKVINFFVLCLGFLTFRVGLTRRLCCRVWLRMSRNWS